MNNLAQRVVTAVVMIACLMLLLFKASAISFAAVLFVFGLLAVWELWRLILSNNKHSLWVMALVYSACAVQFWTAQWVHLLWIIGVVHFFVTLYVLWAKPILTRLITGFYGAVLLATVVYAVTVLQSFGAWVLMTAMIVVWATDVGGYFFGKGLGGKLIKQGLAPNISPKKSWEGAIGGAWLAVVVTLGCALCANEASDFKVWVTQTVALITVQPKNQSLVFLFCFIVLPTSFIAAYSVTGDLMESLLKRQAGVKDSSQLLPGHGGILDRIDALIPVLPICAAWVYFVSYRT